MILLSTSSCLILFIFRSNFTGMDVRDIPFQLSTERKSPFFGVGTTVAIVHASGHSLASPEHGVHCCPVAACGLALRLTSNLCRSDTHTHTPLLSASAVTPVVCATFSTAQWFAARLSVLPRAPAFPAFTAFIVPSAVTAYFCSTSKFLSLGVPTCGPDMLSLALCANAVRQVTSRIRDGRAWGRYGRCDGSGPVARTSWGNGVILWSE